MPSPRLGSALAAAAATAGVALLVRALIRRVSNISSAPAADADAVPPAVSPAAPPAEAAAPPSSPPSAPPVTRPATPPTAVPGADTSAAPAHAPPSEYVTASPAEPLDGAAYLGALCAHSFIRGAPPSSRLRYDRFRLTVAPLERAATDEVWAFLRAHPLHGAARLVLPAAHPRFADCTRAALEAKVDVGRAFAARCEGAVVGLFCAFDDDVRAPGGWERHYACVVAPALETGDCGAAFLNFAQLPCHEAVRAADGRPLGCAVVTGPFMNDGTEGPGDVELRLKLALAAANFRRTGGSHMRLYRRAAQRA
jgi:hypothetical protein